MALGAGAFAFHCRALPCSRKQTTNRVWTSEPGSVPLCVWVLGFEFQMIFTIEKQKRLWLSAVEKQEAGSGLLTSDGDVLPGVPERPVLCRTPTLCVGVCGCVVK